MNAGSDWPSSRALLKLKPSRMRWALKSTRTILQTARNCAEQFSILWPGEKCQSKNGVVEILALLRNVGRRYLLISTEGHAHREHDFQAFGIAWQYRWGGGY